MARRELEIWQSFPPAVRSVTTAVSTSPAAAIDGSTTQDAAAYRAELDAFVAAVKGRQAAKPDGDDGLKALLLADAATESAATGRTVTIE